MNFLDQKSSKTVKLFYTFKMFDCDNDNQISGPDVVDVIDRITDGDLTSNETSRVFKYVLREGVSDDAQNFINFFDFESK